jgi:hypothetical protein
MNASVRFASVGIEALRAAAKAVTLPRHNDRAEPIVFAAEPGDLPYAALARQSAGARCAAGSIGRLPSLTSFEAPRFCD